MNKLTALICVGILLGFPELSHAQSAGWMGYAATLKAGTPSPLPSPAANQPVGVNAPAGKAWVSTFDDEMNGIAMDTTKWDYEYSGTLWCTPGANCANVNAGGDISEGQGYLASAPTVGANPPVGDQEGDAETGDSAMGGLYHFSQRYGYFEARVEMPHDTSGEGNGLHPTAFWLLPNGKTGFPDSTGNSCVTDTGNEEIDVAESVLNTTQDARDLAFWTVHDCNFNEYQVNNPDVGNLSAAYHAYGVDWVNDGTPHGTIYFYLDGGLVGSHTLDANSKLWDNGVYILIGNETCAIPPFFYGAACNSQGPTSNSDPVLIDYVRAWQAE